MKKRKSFILMIALLITASLVIMVSGFSVSVLYRNQVYMRYINSQKAYYMASAGAQYGRFKYQRWYNTWYSSQQGVTPQFPDNIFSIPQANVNINVKYSYNKLTGILEIQSTATTKNASKTFKCDVDAGESAAFYSLYYTRKAPVLKWE